MDDTRSDDLIRRNHELLAAAARAWSDFMETVARIDHAREQERMRRALWYGLAGAARAWSEGTDPTSITSHRLTTLTGCWTGWSG